MIFWGYLVGIAVGFLVGFTIGALTERRYWTAHEFKWLRYCSTWALGKIPSGPPDMPDFPPFPWNIPKVVRWVRGQPSWDSIHADSYNFSAELDRESPAGEEWKS